MDDTAKPAGYGRTVDSNIQDPISAVTSPAKTPDGQGRVLPGLLIGYARISRGDSQDLRRQIDELQIAGCASIYSDELSGGRAAESRPGFADALSHLRAGDTLVTVSLDRMSRSLSDLMSTIDDLVEAGVTIRILNLGDIDSRSPLGRVLLQILGAVSELERRLISERTLSGLAAAKRAGVRIGRPNSLTKQQIAGVIAMRATGSSAVATGRAFGVSERTVRRVCAQAFNGR